MTGSAVIGGFRSDSDIDVAFPIYKAETVNKMLTIQSTKLGFRKDESFYNSGYKLVKNGSVMLNVISLHPFDYCAWLFATNILKKQCMIPDRLIRHRAFELAVTLFKLSNSNTDYVTINGADIYFLQHHPKTLMSEFDEFVKSQNNATDLPF